MTPSVRIMRVLGTRSHQPVVLAAVDQSLVRWNPDKGWTCDCDTDDDECVHVDTIVDLIDPRVTGGRP